MWWGRRIGHSVRVWRDTDIGYLWDKVSRGCSQTVESSGRWGLEGRTCFPVWGDGREQLTKAWQRIMYLLRKLHQNFLSAFSILISLLIFSSPSLSTQIPQYLTSVTLLLVSSKFSSHQPFYITIHLAKSWKILFVLPCTCAQDVNHRWREPRRGSLGSL